MNYKTNRLLDQPVGDPFSGPAYYGKPWLSARPGYRDAAADAVSDVVKFQSNAGQDARDLYAKDPERIFLGANTPLESELWGTILGKDYEPTVDMYGGTTQHNSETAAARGINTGPGEAMHNIARAITTFYAGGALSKAVSGGTAATTGTEGAASDGVLSGADLEPIDIPGSEGPSLAEGQAGVSTSGSNTISGNTGSESLSGNTGGNTLASPNMPPANAETPASLEGQGLRQTGPSGEWQQAAPTTPAKGLIQSSLDFVKENPLATVGAGQLVSGVVSGVGNNITQNQLADKKAKADRELLAARTQEEANALEARRRFVQSGSYYSAAVPMRAGPQQPLRRPDGTSVYAPNGLIASAMR